MQPVTRSVRARRGLKPYASNPETAARWPFLARVLSLSATVGRVTAPAAIIEQVARELRAHGSYDSYFERQRAAYADDLARLTRARAQSPLLEVGGFPFHFSRCLTLAGYDVQSVDLNPERASSWLLAQRIRSVRCDVEREPLPFPDCSARTVVLDETFEHFRIDPLFALAQIARVLEPGGLLYLTTPNFYRLGNVLRFLLGRGLSNDPLHEYGKLATVGHMGHVREYTAREMSALSSTRGVRAARDRASGAAEQARPPGGSGARRAHAIQPQPRYLCPSILALTERCRPMWVAGLDGRSRGSNRHDWPKGRFSRGSCGQHLLCPRLSRYGMAKHHDSAPSRRNYSAQGRDAFASPPAV